MINFLLPSQDSLSESQFSLLCGVHPDLGSLGPEVAGGVVGRADPVLIPQVLRNSETGDNHCGEKDLKRV